MSESKEKIERQKIIHELWRRGDLTYLLKGVQKDICQDIKNANKKVNVIGASRRLGKCLAEGTTILTTKGIKNIEDISIGDFVYGYNKDGSITPTKVLDVFCQGEKLVYDYINNTKVVETATLDHKWLTCTTDHKKIVYKEKKAEDITNRDKIIRKFIDCECGEINEPHAYAIGVLLGDGCSRQGFNTIHVSGKDYPVIEKVKNVLNVPFVYNDKNNFTWILSNNPHRNRHDSFGDRNYKNPVKCNYYNEWINNRYAHEKVIDLEILKTWNRKSCLELLAGLLDSDGSVIDYKTLICINYTSQSYSMMKAIRFLILQLFQYEVNIGVDKRDKYKNGNCFYINIRNNLFCKRILRELDQYIKCDRKKWKDKYFNYLERNTNKDYVGVKFVNPRIMRTWDISVDNETHLYLTAKGLVTHNSFCCIKESIEVLLNKKNGIVKYLCPEQVMVQRNINPIVQQIIEDAPEDLRPEWKENAKEWVFKHNNSKLQIAGSDKGHIEKLRGGHCDMGIVDEGAFCTDLDYAIKSVLLPTTLTTKGKIIIASTPNPKDPQHEFNTKYLPMVIDSENSRVYTIHDAPMITKEDIADIIKEYPSGEQDPAFRCEYLCEICISPDAIVVPEFDKEAENDIVIEVEKPRFYDAYGAMDVGFRDLTGVLFAYYDYRGDRLVIDDELVMNGPSLTTENLAFEIKHREMELFEGKEMFMRVADNNNLILLNDLLRLHNILFVPTAKDNKEAQINQLRMLISQRKLVINPRCKHLIYHLKFARWNKKRNSFERIKDSLDRTLRGGHADLLDALIYLVRNYMPSKDPYPYNFDDPQGDNVFRKDKKEDSPIKDFMFKLVGIRK